jgi:hypothetical protein
MRKPVFGVAPSSYSGSQSQVVIRARALLVTLLDGIISEESSKTHPDPHPIFLTAPASNESTTPNLNLFIIAC